MKNILKVFMLISILFCSGCTNQQPVSQAPVYNVTLTDNSQYIVGDNNAAETKATTTAEQVAKPDVSAAAQKKGSDMFLFWLGFVLGLATFGAGLYLYKRLIKT